VPPVIAEIIKRDRLFGYRGSPEPAERVAPGR
jgi:hypothetical protein